MIESGPKAVRLSISLQVGVRPQHRAAVRRGSRWNETQGAVCYYSDTTGAFLGPARATS
jgi:hypothetical protein